MYSELTERLSALAADGLLPLLAQGKIGLEKETLRVNSEGKIAQTPHPPALGSPLTNPYITTDYSEALLEFITPPCDSGEEALQTLCDIHRFVLSRLDEELLWATSMPCVVAGESSIPLARYGSSNIGTMKTVYRRGLGYRYGRTMQVIAGVHFNYSFAEALWPRLQRLDAQEGLLRDYVSGRYFGLLRNLQRVGWMIPYLFGASPAICKSFVGGVPGTLESFDEWSFYGPHATSLRMGDIGYQNNKENEVGVKACYDNLEEYIDTLNYAISTPYPGYEKIGIEVDGVYRQLNANILQIENEYYSTVRPKQLLEGNEKPILALKRRGVRYIELRSLDVNPYAPTGIDIEQIRFLEALMIFCLLIDSPPIAPWERVEIDRNEMVVAHRGREPGLELVRNGESLPLRRWAEEILTTMEPICHALDQGREDCPYTTALNRQWAVVAEPALTPSARMVREMAERRQSFFSYARALSEHQRDHFAAQPLPAEREAYFTRIAEESLAEQRAIEAAERQPFGAFLKAYSAQ